MSKQFKEDFAVTKIRNKNKKEAKADVTALLGSAPKLSLRDPGALFL